MSAPDRRLVLVVGVGRSGTSLMSGMLGQLGLSIPQPEVKANETNPRGFGEPRWVVDLHTRLLKRRLVTVNDARPAAWSRTGNTMHDGELRRELTAWIEGQVHRSAAIVVKDPRTVWFLPLWTACAADLGIPTSYITMLRHPAEIVASARKYYGQHQTATSRAAAWINVILQTERLTRGGRRAWVRYEDLLDDWVPQIRRTGDLLALPALAQVGRESHPAVDAFVDPTLHRNRVVWEDLDVAGPVRDMAEDVWALLQPLAEPDGDRPEGAGAFDAAWEAYQAMYSEAEMIAQSSVIVAARRQPKRASDPRLERTPTLRVRVARRIPPPWRRRLRRLAGSLPGRS